MKRVLSIILFVVIMISVFAAVPVEIFAEENDIAEIGNFNGTSRDCTWILDDDGVLTISGNGETDEYYSYYPSPWENNPNIKK